MMPAHIVTMSHTRIDTGVLPGYTHFILECKNSTLLELRDKYISSYYSSQPSMDKLVELFNNRGQKLFKLARYVAEGLKLY